MPEPTGQTGNDPQGALPPANPDSDLLSSLHQEARSQVKRHSAGERLWALLFVAALIVLAISLFGIYTRMSAMRAAALRLAAQPSPTRAAGTASPAAVVPPAQSTPEIVFYTPAPTIPAAIAPPSGSGPVDRAGATATAASACLDASQYQLTVSDVTVSPPPGTLFQEGDGQQAEATWTVRNQGNCDWRQLRLLSPANLLISTPLLFQNGQPLVLDIDSGTVVSPQQEIQVRLAFPAAAARTVLGDWVLFINSVPLYAQPHLTLDVKEWLVPANPTPASGRGSSPALPTRQTPNPSPRRTPSGPPVSRPTATPANPYP